MRPAIHSEQSHQEHFDHAGGQRTHCVTEWLAISANSVRNKRSAALVSAGSTAGMGGSGTSQEFLAGFIAGFDPRACKLFTTAHMQSMKTRTTSSGSRGDDYNIFGVKSDWNENRETTMGALDTHLAAYCCHKVAGDLRDLRHVSQ